MRKFIKGFLIFILSVFVLIAVADFLWINIPKVQARKNIDDINLYARDIDEINLDENVKIVGLGEATHGNSDFQDLKLEVLKTLVEKNNLKSFAIEADFGEGMVINDYIHGDKKDENISKVFSFNIYHTKEMNDLINWMFDYNQNAKDEDKISFYGFDMQNPEKSISLILKFAKENNILKDKNLDERFSFITEEKYSIEKLKENEEILKEIKSNVDTLSSNDARLISRAITNVLDSIKYYGIDFNDYVKANNFRDKYMAENVNWIGDFEKSKGNNLIMISGHNGHIGKKSNFYKTMGANLKDIYKDDYFIIGTDFYKTIVNINEIVEGRSRSNHSFTSADPLAYSARKFNGKYYLDFSNVKEGDTHKIINSKINMGSLGEGYSWVMKLMPTSYRIKEKPADLYDAMIFIYYAKPINVIEQKGD
ncbi:erythromycin esterase family protein [Peptoniphilus ovalis]|uniref:erythromycin esterase family protein n=1 Tax=Peptoniphilus ovalis TaxID=2841503 RepID=UPI001FE8D9F8|nr:erythromycin esterase family protein [Peptoniphilus ovalis]